jgi:hypothetical protein
VVTAFVCRMKKVIAKLIVHSICAATVAAKQWKKIGVAQIVIMKLVAVTVLVNCTKKSIACWIVWMESVAMDIVQDKNGSGVCSIAVRSAMIQVVR